MSTTVDKELKSLLSYYGENPESPEAPKPEDFFGLVASFSSSLQVNYSKIIVLCVTIPTFCSRNVLLRYTMPKASRLYLFPKLRGSKPLRKIPPNR